MKSASRVLSRVASAVLAAVCSLGILVVLGQQLDPTRLAATPPVTELERVVITAPAPAPAAVATVRAATATN